MKAAALLLAAAAALAGCASVGIECAGPQGRVWARYRRPGWSVSTRQALAIGIFRATACPPMPGGEPEDYMLRSCREKGRQTCGTRDTCYRRNGDAWFVPMDQEDCEQDNQKYR